MKSEKVEQLIFSSRYVERMFIEVIESGEISKYGLNTFPSEDEFPKGGTGIYIEKNVELALPEGRNLKDLENTKTLFSAYSQLTPAQASDPRLWTYLCHVTFWKYMQHRWPLEKAKIPISRIRDRYFLRRLNLESLSRNGISRLWWYGYLTYDESRLNPWELTEVLLSRADLSVGIVERAFGCNKNIREGILEYLSENSDIRNNESFTRELFVNLNLAGGVKNLPFLEKDEIKEILESLNPVSS